MLNKIIFYVLFLITLNGCVQGVAFLGPVISYSESGSIFKSALSYGSNIALKKIRTGSITEDKKNAFDNHKSINNNKLIEISSTNKQ